MNNYVARECAYVTTLKKLVDNQKYFLERFDNTIIDSRIEYLQELIDYTWEYSNPEASDKEKAIQAGTYDAVMYEAQRQIHFLKDIKGDTT